MPDAESSSETSFALRTLQSQTLEAECGRIWEYGHSGKGSYIHMYISRKQETHFFQERDNIFPGNTKYYRKQSILKETGRDSFGYACDALRSDPPFHRR